jgi:hypothetical protein
MKKGLFYGLLLGTLMVFVFGTASMVIGLGRTPGEDIYKAAIPVSIYSNSAGYLSTTIPITVYPMMSNSLAYWDVNGNTTLAIVSNAATYYSRMWDGSQYTSSAFDYNYNANGVTIQVEQGRNPAITEYAADAANMTVPLDVANIESNGTSAGVLNQKSLSLDPLRWRRFKVSGTANNTVVVIGRSSQQ